MARIIVPGEMLMCIESFCPYFTVGKYYTVVDADNELFLNCKFNYIELLDDEGDAIGHAPCDIGMAQFEGLDYSGE